MRQNSAWAGALVIIGLALSTPSAWAVQTRRAAVDKPGEPLIVTLATDQSFYAVGQPVRMKLTLCNASAEPVTLRFHSGYRYDFRASQVPGGRVVWQWSQDKLFVQAVSEWTLEPGETWEATAWWNPQVPVGIYALDAGVICDAPAPLMSPPVMVRIGDARAGHTPQSEAARDGSLVSLWLPPEPMRIRFTEYDGGGISGFAGYRATVDTREIAVEEARRLQGWVAAAAFWSLPPELFSPAESNLPPSCDREGIWYELTVETPGRQHTVATDGIAVPPALAQLQGWLMAHAQPVN
jgi:hypothetical protein